MKGKDKSYGGKMDSKLPPSGNEVVMKRNVGKGPSGSGDVRPPANGPMGTRMSRDMKKSSVSASGDVRPEYNGPMGKRMPR